MSVNVPRAGLSARTVAAAALVAGSLGFAGWWAASARAESPAPAAPVVAAQSQPAAPPAGRYAVTSYADAVARVAPGVVTVRVEKKAGAEPTGMPDDLFRRFFGQDRAVPGSPAPRARPGQRRHRVERRPRPHQRARRRRRRQGACRAARRARVRRQGRSASTRRATSRCSTSRRRTCRSCRSPTRTRRASATSSSPSATRSAWARRSRWASSAPRAGRPASATAATRTSCRPTRRSTTATPAARW